MNCFQFRQQNNKLGIKYYLSFTEKHMSILKRFLLTSILILPVLNSCSDQKTNNDRIVIGISSDIKTINPLFTISVNEGTISELLYPALIDFKWNKVKGGLDVLPMIAKTWEWLDDSTSLLIKLRKDVYWTDGKQLTADDILFSFDIYSDTLVQSRLYGTIETLFTDKDNQVDLKKSFTVISPFEISVHFRPDRNPSIYDLGVPILPKHIFEKIDRQELAESDKNYEPVTSGAYKLFKWDKNQDVILAANEKSFLYNKEMPKQLIFKVIPEYTSRLNQLEKNEIDLMDQVKTEDIKSLEKNNDLVIESTIGREYDYIGWNNIDIKTFHEDTMYVPNKLFGNPEIRKALTYAINRNEIMDQYLLGYAEISNGPVSSIFKKEINKDLEPIEYNPEKSKEIFEQNGWKDSNNNGIIDKEGTEFKFTLSIPIGNPLREYASTIIQNNLRSVGIDMKIETYELGMFIDNLYNKSMDAYMAAWFIPIPLQFKPYWYSDPEIAPINFVSYRSKEADEILDKLDSKISEREYISYVREFQRVLYKDQPVTFLYWTPNFTAYDKRIKNIDVSPYGIVTHCWEWKIAD
jgi:peptide/nickel transport system substrate-binding protein